MLVRLKIERLFGRFDYNIEFKSGGVSILTGPNGYGKSTILHIINSISNKKIYELFEYEFKKIELFFRDDIESWGTLREKNIIEKRGEKLFIDKIEASPKLLKKIFATDNRHTKNYYSYFNRKRHLLEDEEFIGQYLDDKNDIESILSYIKDNDKEEKNVEKRLSYIMDKISKACGKTRLISDQRLLKKIRRMGEDEIRDTISSLPNALKDIIEGVSSEYSVTANSLDSTYPKRLLSSKQGITEMKYRHQFIDAQAKFRKLKEYKLSNISLLEGGIYNERYADALKIYFDDFFTKYQVFEKIINQLDLFTFVINNRLRFKHIEISKEKGFILIDEIQQKELDLKKLSSGEKQEILLFFELIFNTNSHEVLLIDEPELSLHISWQQQFMDDLLKVTQMNNLQVVIATHSPQIIGNHWDIQIDLGELYNGY